MANVFRPASERGEPKTDPSPEEAARAQSGFRLLESFAGVPGRIGHAVDAEVLKNWVTTVRELANERDRVEIAEQYIGKMLFHAPSDPEGGIWPHRTVREGLENWQSPQIENGMYIAKANARGATWRAPLDGGSQERDLAIELRTEARKLSMWPRTRAIFVALAESYEREADRQDIEAAQLRLRE